MQLGHKFGETAKAVIAGFIVVGGLVASTLPASATTTAPTTVDTTLVGSGSDTTYDMMKAIDKVYAGANGCATIWYTGETQPFNGTCSQNDLASGNGADATKYPWVNDGHTVVSERYPVGSGNGVKELCYQGLANVRSVDFARSSSSSSTTCSDLTYVGYAKDAVSWYHATKDKTGAATTSAKVVSIAKADLTKIYNGTYTLWSDLNGKAKDVNGDVINDLASNAIKVYTVQAGSGTLSYWTSNVAAPKTGALTTGQENAPTAIFDDNNEADAIYFMSYGRYKQAAGITGQPDTYSGNSVAAVYPLAADALGKIDDVAPTNTTLVASSGAFPLARTVYNVLRFPSAETLKYVGPAGFICSETIGAIKDRISGKTYRSLISDAIIAEGFVPLPSGTTGGGQVGTSYCRVSKSGSPVADITAPSVGVDAGATYSGKASATFVFSEPVRGIDTSKFTAEGSVASTTTATSGIFKSAISGNLPVTLICYNQRSVVVPNCESGSADTDPYQTLAVKSVKVTINAAKANSVRFTADAGAGTDLAANTSTAFSTSAIAVADFGAGVSVKGAWAGDTSRIVGQTKTYTLKGDSITIALTGTSTVTVDGKVIYNPNQFTTATGGAKTYTRNYLAAGTYTISSSSIIAANGAAIGATFSGKVNKWHTIAVTVKTGPVAVTALSAS
jgi:hypothetical protein